MTKTEKLATEARLWAELDGCEGGDVLRALAHALEMAHYSLYDQEVLESFITSAIYLEISVHQEADSSYQDPEFVEEIMKKIKEIRESD